MGACKLKLFSQRFFNELPEHQRGDAVSSMVYEANARVRDPVYGCVGAISSLQQQIDVLQTQLALAQAEVVQMRMRQFSSISPGTATNSPDHNNITSPSSSRHTQSHHDRTSLFAMGMVIDHQASMGESLWSC
ncbi:LOB domain-containing protein 4-like [Coffea eugenioides]|uniref:LOB domain-containing protein 4-like n=1 Tax=Coffea eugenioides TaxID=49369 RepID=UPI000F614D1F|nr:LOB domain-containing protein 4-like [Coffea eugenioides]